MLGRLRKAAAALVAGAIMVSGAWAGASLVPVDEEQVTVAEKAGAGVLEPEGGFRAHPGG